MSQAPEPRPHDLREGDALTEAWRMVQADAQPGQMFPYANGPLLWTRAAALAQVDAAASLRDIATALQDIARQMGGPT